MESVSCDLQCKMQPHSSDFLNKFSELYHTKLSIAYVHPSPKRCVRDTMSRNPAQSDTDKIDDNLVQMLLVFGPLVPNQPTNSTCAPSASRLCSFFGPAQQIAHNISSWPLRVDRSGQLEHQNISNWNQLFVQPYTSVRSQDVTRRREGGAETGYATIVEL